MKMKNWKYRTILFILLITFFSCAGRPPVITPDEQTPARDPSPAASIRENFDAQWVKSDPDSSEAAGSFVPRTGTPNNPAITQPSAGQSQNLQTAPANPSHNPANPDTAPRKKYSDYRSQALATKLRKPSPDQSALGETSNDFVELNFDNADIHEVIATIAELTGIKYVAEPGIQGKVTIHTTDGIARENLLSALYLILEANGLTAVKDGEFYRITSVEDASRLPILLRLQTKGRPYVRKKEIVTQIIPLKYITAAEISQLLQPFLSANATIIAHEGSNTVLVVDTGINIMKALKLVEAFDISLFEKTNHRFFFLRNTDAEDVVKILKDVFALNMEGRKDGVKFIAIKRLNAFLALSSDTRMFTKIQQLLLNLDATTEGIEPRIYVYFVKNGSALNLANLLNQVFAEAITNGQDEKKQSRSPGFQKPALGRMTEKEPVAKPGLRLQAKAATRPTQLPQQAEASPGVTTEATAGGTFLKGTVKITPDEIRNGLIIEATPADYRVILNVLKTIDVLPRQVLIEATIAEIDYSIVTDLGLNWEFLRGADFGSGLLSGTVSGDTGLTAAIGISDELRATLNALERQNKVNILSSPHVLASDNQEARIDVSQEIPTVTAETVVPTSGEAIVTTTVQYRDTGVLLAVTPHINERRLVTMDIYQEVSEQAEDVQVAGESFPSFFKRVVQTSLTVQHGQTIVLGGLIRENKSKSSSGVPWLAKIPVIGFIFGATRDAFDKTELIILLTPKVIVGLDDVDAITDGFKSKVDSVVKEMYEKRSIP
jgi:general secretion pathway protein D